MIPKRSSSLQPLLTPISVQTTSLVHSSSQKYAPKIVIKETELPSPSQQEEAIPSITSSPLIRLETDEPSMFNMKKLLLNGDDEFLDQALIKLESIMRKQLQKSERKKLDEERERIMREKEKAQKEDEKKRALRSPGKAEVSPPAPNTRNQDIIQRITNYKSVKGINPRTKEVRFEEKMNTFKEIKTFVDIKQLVKDIGTPEISLSPKRKSESPGHSSLKRYGSNETAFREIVPLNLDASGYSNLLHSTVRDEAPPVYLAPVFTGPGKKTDESMSGGILDSFAMDKLQEAKNKEARKKEKMNKRIEVAYSELKSQVIKHMGPDILEEMKKKKATLEPRTVKEITLQNRIELYNIRQAQRNLKNFELFNTVMNHLSAAEADVGEPLVRKDEGPEEFYQQMEKTIFAEDETEVNDEITMAMERLDDEREEIEIEEIKPRESKTIALKGVPESLWQDEQIRMINAVQEYKKRSDRVIKILKNRTKRIHSSEKKVRAEIRDAKEKLNNICTPAFSETEKSPSNFTKAFDETQLPRIDEYMPKGLEPIREASVQTPMSHNISFLGFEKIRAKSSFGKQPVVESPTNLNFYKNVMENKKKYMEMTDKSLKTGSPQFASRGRLLWNKEEDRRQIQPVKSTKAQKLKYSYAASVSKLSNDVSGLLAGNKSLGNEIKQTLEETDKFYDSKTQSFNVKNIPEALKLPKKGPSFSKRAHLILDLTRDLFKNQKKVQ